MVAEPGRGARGAWLGRIGQRRFWDSVDPDAPRFPAPAGQTVLQPDLEEGRISEGVKAHKAMNPASGPATPAEARVRVEGALARFDQECRRRVDSGQHVVSTGFGTVSVEDFVRFQALHTRHHCKQMPGAT
jgi:hypothetical protein